MQILENSNNSSCCPCGSGHPYKELNALPRQIGVVPRPSVEVHFPSIVAYGKQKYRPEPANSTSQMRANAKDE